MKTDLEAAKHYFKDNLTQPFKQQDPQLHNLSNGLYFLAESLQRIEDRLETLESRLNALSAIQQHQK